MSGWAFGDAWRRAYLVRLDVHGKATSEERAELAALTERLRAAVRPQWDAARVRAERALALAEARSADSGTALPACRECDSFDPCEHDRGGV